MRFMCSFFLFFFVFSKPCLVESLTLLALSCLLLRCSMPQITPGYLPVPMRLHRTADPIVCTGARTPEKSGTRKGEAGRGEGNGPGGWRELGG